MSRISVDPGRELAALAVVGGLDGARVLEVGCGDGRLTFAYASRARSVLAIDPDKGRIADVVDLQQPPAAFDAVFLSHSL